MDLEQIFSQRHHRGAGIGSGDIKAFFASDRRAKMQYRWLAASSAHE
jgi:hypothetical protein